MPFNIDHLGNEYRSQAAMCKAYHLNENTFINRVNKKHMSIEEALCTKPEPMCVDKKIKDHLGNEYCSITALAKAYGLTKKILLCRLKTNKSMEEILLTPYNKKDEINIECKDHLGQVFPSKRAMVKHYGITWSTYRYRTDARWSLKDTLTTPIIQPTVFDHNGVEFSSLKEMLKHYKIKKGTYARRKALGLSLEECLTMDVGQRKKDGLIGEKIVTRAGQTAIIIEYRSAKDVDVQFEDGIIVRNINYKTIIYNGNLKNPNLDTGYKRIQVAYKMKDGTIAMYCKCNKCKQEYVGTWRDVYAHKCIEYKLIENGD